MRALVDRTLIQEKIQFRSEISANGIEAIKLLVQRGLGFAFVLKSLVQEEIKSGLLKEVTLPIALPKRGISVAARINDPVYAWTGSFFSEIHRKAQLKADVIRSRKGLAL